MDVLKRIQKDNQGNILTKLLSDKVFESSYRSIVVLANTKKILNAKFTKKEVKEKVIRADQLIKYIKTVNSQSKSAPSSDKDLKELAETLLNRHNSDQTDYTKKYEEIIGDIQVSDPVPLKTVALEPPKPFDNDKLISDLKAFRLKRSREENIKPYYIYNDAQMMDLVSKMPDSKEEMLSVAGFGHAKVNKYGEAILEILSKYVG